MCYFTSGNWSRREGPDWKCNSGLSRKRTLTVLLFKCYLYIPASLCVSLMFVWWHGVVGWWCMALVVLQFDWSLGWTIFSRIAWGGGTPSHTFHFQATARAIFKRCMLSVMEMCKNRQFHFGRLAIILVPWVRQYRKIFSSQVPCCPLLLTGQYCFSHYYFSPDHAIIMSICFCDVMFVCTKVSLLGIWVNFPSPAMFIW